MARLDLGKVVSEIVEVKTTIDDNYGVPSVTASLSGTQTEKILNLDFKNLKGKQGLDGEKPIKGVDYFTEEDKKEFTNSINGSITTEGQKQLQAITNKGTEAVNAVTKVQTDIENILSNHGAEGNALSLNGKTGQQYDKEIQGVLGQCDGTFPLTKAEVNKVYLVPQTGKNYKCTKAYDGVQISAPNANFEDLSVLENSNRLSNLSEYKTLKTYPIGDVGDSYFEILKSGKQLWGYLFFRNRSNIPYKINAGTTILKIESEYKPKYPPYLAVPLISYMENVEMTSITLSDILYANRDINVISRAKVAFFRIR